MKYFAQFWVIALLCVGSALAQSNLPSSKSTPYCGRTDFDDYADSKHQEELCLQMFAKIATRSGNSLRLQIGSDAAQFWESNPQACHNDDAAACVEYRLVGYHASAGFFLIRGQGYEEHWSKLVDSRNGRVMSLSGTPHFSPDGSTFIAFDDYPGHLRNYEFAVGSVATRPPSLFWIRPTNQDEYWEFRHWIDKDHVAIRQTEVRCDVENCEAVLERTDNGWTLQRKPARSSQ